MSPNVIEIALSTENVLLKGRVSKLEEQLNQRGEVIKELRIIRGLAEARYMDAEAEVKVLKEQLKFALQGVDGYHPICERCGRVCVEVTIPENQIYEYTCRYCLERYALKKELKRLKPHASELGAQLYDTAIERIEELEKQNEVAKARTKKAREWLTKIKDGETHELEWVESCPSGRWILDQDLYDLEETLGRDDEDNLTQKEVETFFKDFMKNVDELVEIDEDPTDEEEKGAESDA